RCLPLQFDQPLRSGIRLRSPQLGQMISELQVAAARPAELLAGDRVTLLVDRVVGPPLDHLACGEPERLGAGPPPSPGWLARLSGADVITADRLLGAFLVGLVFPHVAEVVALGDGHDHGHGSSSLPRSPGAELTMIIR